MPSAAKGLSMPVLNGSVVGVIDTKTNTVEHPELVAQRLAFQILSTRSA
jgi:hypothetical protein